MKVMFMLLGLALLSFAIAGERSGTLVQQAPRKFIQLRNPFEGNPKAVQAGGKLFDRECAACHGKNARGVGKAPPLVLRHVYGAAPGALFWVLRNGSLRRGMPSYAHLPEQ